jgi:hypothetical protein
MTSHHYLFPEDSRATKAKQQNLSYVTLVIFRCDFFELKELIDVKPEAGSCYIKSVCEPFNIKMELDLKKAENWLTHFRLYP